MPRITYTATDAAGNVHTRSTAYACAYTVVIKGGYSTALAGAKRPGHAKTDRSNFAHDRLVATGRDPHPHQCYRTREFGWGYEEIAYEKSQVEAANAKRVAKAQAAIEGRTVDSYIADELAKRIASVEAEKAAGKFDTWFNAGWCGRRDLAEKLAAKHRAADYVVSILEAVELKRQAAH